MISDPAGGAMERVNNNGISIIEILQMKKIGLSILAGIFLLPGVYAQSMEKSAPAGFDEARTGIATGKVDTVSYSSKTVGVTRRAVVYTPPGYKKSGKYPVL